MADYVRHVREHVRQLSAKSYWQQFDDSPDFVIMFLPGEGFYRAAIEADPSLLESGANERVVLASPMMLIALLRTIAAVWNEEKVAESARLVSELGRELYHETAVFDLDKVLLGGDASTLFLSGRLRQAPRRALLLLIAAPLLLPAALVPQLRPLAARAMTRIALGRRCGIGEVSSRCKVALNSISCSCQSCVFRAHICSSSLPSNLT